MLIGKFLDPKTDVEMDVIITTTGLSKEEIDQLFLISC